MEHARDTLSLMRMDTSTTDNCFERLQQVKHFAEKDPSTGYNMAVDAFLNAYNSVNTETTQALRVERFRHTNFASYFKEAKPIALRGSLKPLPVFMTTTHYDAADKTPRLQACLRELWMSLLTLTRLSHWKRSLGILRNKDLLIGKESVKRRNLVALW